jgi:NADH:ubiquinone oxidoreductase subunit 5 (subunit L)/multisubunit Na+/H+ antiporter MnhA subunit
VSKDEVLAAALHRSTALYATGLAAAAVSAVYSIKAVWYLWQPLPADAGAGYDTERAGTRTITWPMRPPLVVLAVLAAGLGVLALPPTAGYLAQALHAAGQPSPRPWELGTSALVAVAAAGLTWWWGARPAPVPGPARAWLSRWLDLEAAAYLLMARPVMRLARGLAAFDDQVLDRAVHGLAHGGARLARLAARADDSGVDEIVTGVAAGARWLGRVARRPQTGQVYTYYAQATVVLAVLALAFVLAVVL